jgi:peptidoglycan/LPS O-acetylase OafA/YrhL
VPSSTSSCAGRRLAFLDAARALAAAAVFVQHWLDSLSPAFARFSREVFNFGVLGVILFFLVSGYIIPVSLERSGSLKRFWVGRVFRLYPLYLVCLGVLLLLWKTGVRELPADFVAGLPHSLWRNATMLQEWLSVPHADPLFWTLGYELLFYGLCSLLFLSGFQRRTLTLCWVGIGLLAVANVLLPLGLHRPGFKIRTFWVLTFFIGTLYHRLDSGALSRRACAAVLAALAGSVAAGAWVNFILLHQPVDPKEIAPPAYLSAWVAAYACFQALLFLRTARFPQAVVRFGEISYSVYLLQDSVLALALLAGSAWWSAAAAPVLCIALASLTYRFVEQPGIALGRRLVSGRAEPAQA